MPNNKKKSKRKANKIKINILDNDLNKHQNIDNVQTDSDNSIESNNLNGSNGKLNENISHSNDIDNNQPNSMQTEHGSTYNSESSIHSAENQAEHIQLESLDISNINNKCWYGKIPCTECNVPDDLHPDIKKHYKDFLELQKDSLEKIKKYGNEFFNKHNESIDCIVNIRSDVHALEVLHSTLLKSVPQKKYSIEYIDTLYFQKKIIAYELETYLKLETMYLDKFYGDLYKLHFKLDNYISSLINLNDDIKLEIQSYPIDFPKYNNVQNDQKYNHDDIKKLGILVLKNVIHISKCICAYLLNIDSLQTNEDEGYHVTDFLTNLTFETCKVMIEIGFFYKILLFIFKYHHEFAISSHNKIRNISEEINIKHNSI